MNPEKFTQKSLEVIRTAQGGVKNYTTAGTNSLWKSLTMSKKYRDLTWRQTGIDGACAGMLAFKREGGDVHHVGLVTGEGTVIHSSSVYGGQCIDGIRRRFEKGDSDFGLCTEYQPHRNVCGSG